MSRGGGQEKEGILTDGAAGLERGERAGPPAPAEEHSPPSCSGAVPRVGTQAKGWTPGPKVPPLLTQGSLQAFLAWTPGTQGRTSILLPIRAPTPAGSSCLQGIEWKATKSGDTY